MINTLDFRVGQSPFFKVNSLSIILSAKAEEYSVFSSDVFSSTCKSDSLSALF